MIGYDSIVRVLRFFGEGVHGQGVPASRLKIGAGILFSKIPLATHFFSIQKTRTFSLFQLGKLVKLKSKFLYAFSESPLLSTFLSQIFFKQSACGHLIEFGRGTISSRFFGYVFGLSISSRLICEENSRPLRRRAARRQPFEDAAWHQGATK
mgnify:CR=1 FL=1